MATALKKMAPQEWFALFARSARGLAFGLHETDFGDIQTYIALKRQETGQHARALLDEMLQEKGEASMVESSILANEEPHPVLHAHRLAYLPSEAHVASEAEEEDDVANYPTRIMASIPIRLQTSSLPAKKEGDYRAETELLVESGIIQCVSRHGAWPVKIRMNPWRRLYGLKRGQQDWWLVDRNNWVYAEIISEPGFPEDVVECIPPLQSRAEVTQEKESIEEDESLEQEDTVAEDQAKPEEEVADVETETPAEEVLPEPSQSEGEMVTHLMDDDEMGT